MIIALGKSAAITLGIVSPIMIQKATMPPKALKGSQLALIAFEARIPYKANWAIEIAMSPEAPKQCSIVLSNINV